MNNAIKFNVEYTDTFGGEANYCWVRRRLVTVKEKASDAQVKRAAKKALGLTGVKGEWLDHGDEFTFHPRGMCTVLFVSFHYCAAGKYWECEA